MSTKKRNKIISTVDVQVTLQAIAEFCRSSNMSVKEFLTHGWEGGDDDARVLLETCYSVGINSRRTAVGMLLQIERDHGPITHFKTFVTRVSKDGKGVFLNTDYQAKDYKPEILDTAFELNALRGDSDE